MNGIVIIISIVFVVYSIFKIDKLKKIRYVLALILGALYGFLLLFVGMGINSVLFYILAVIPILVYVFIIIKQDFSKKN